MAIPNPLTNTEPEMVAEKPANPEQAAVIQATVGQIFQSPPFKASRQCQDLLRYVVAHTVSGDDQLLRERIIGMEVFSRQPDYDTGEDPVVRLRASELRKRLAQFYQSDAGKLAPVEISIPSGSYRAIFQWRDVLAHPHTNPGGISPLQPVPASVSLSLVEEQDRYRRASRRLMLSGSVRRKLAGLVSFALLCLFLVAGYLYWHSRRTAALDKFWAPLMEDSHPTLVCMGSNAVYRLSNNFLSEYEKRTGETHDGIEFLINPVPGQILDQRDLLRANNSFVALGDVAAASEFVAFLGRHGKSFTERFPPDMSFAEIQEYSSVLIGGFNNPMSLTIGKDLPFVMKGSDRIEERSGAQRSWMLQFYGDARESEDYALISRLVDPATQHEVVTLGGIGQYGTQAAADFLTDPAYMNAWAADIPKGWEKKNLQIVLHVKIINYRPVQREVVASKTW